MLIKDNTEHRTVLSSMCIAVCNILSHVNSSAFISFLPLFCCLEVTFTQMRSVVNFACLHVTFYSASLSSGDLKEKSPHSLGHSAPGAQIVGLHPVSKNV